MLVILSQDYVCESDMLTSTAAAYTDVIRNHVTGMTPSS